MAGDKVFAEDLAGGGAEDLKIDQGNVVAGGGSGGTIIVLATPKEPKATHGLKLTSLLLRIIFKNVKQSRCNLS